MLPDGLLVHDGCVGYFGFFANDGGGFFFYRGVGIVEYVLFCHPCEFDFLLKPFLCMPRAEFDNAHVSGNGLYGPFLLMGYFSATDTGQHALIFFFVFVKCFERFFVDFDANGQRTHCESWRDLWFRHQVKTHGWKRHFHFSDHLVKVIEKACHLFFNSVKAKIKPAAYTRKYFFENVRN